MLNKINVFLNSTQKFKLLVLLFLVIVASVLEMIGVGSVPVFLGLLIDPEKIISLMPDIALLNYLKNTEYQNQIIYVGIFLFIFFVFKNIFLFYVNFFQSNLLKNLNVVNTNKLFQHYIYSSYPYHLNKNPAIITRSIVSDIQSANTYIISLINLVREVSLILIIFSLLIVVDFFSTTVVFFSLILFVLLFFFVIKKKLVNLAKLNLDLRAKQIKLINQVFGSIKETKIYSRELYFTDQFNTSTDGVEKVAFFTNFINKIPRLIIEIIFIFSILSVIFFFILTEGSIKEIIPTLAFLGVATIRLLPAFNSLSSISTSIKKTEVSFKLIVNDLEKINKLNLNNHRDSVIETQANSKLFNFNNKNITIKNLSFKYSGSDNFILKDINLTIKMGESTAFVGQTGSGKTTIINLISGLLKPTSGEIFIGNSLINTNLSNWFKEISIVPQNIYLLDDSIKKNIAFGIPSNEIDDKNIYRCLELAKLDKFVLSLPTGIETFVGNQGVRLSGGQQQRLGIARALYRKTKILILDEATSSLDLKTEKRLVEDLESLKEQYTLITITHRLSIIKNYDKIFLINEGIIKDSGNFVELSSRNKNFNL